MDDCHLKPPMLRSVVCDHLLDKKRPFPSPADLVGVLSHVRAHGLLSEQQTNTTERKLVEDWRTAVNGWVEYRPALTFVSMTGARASRANDHCARSLQQIRRDGSRSTTPPDSLVSRLFQPTSTTIMAPTTRAHVDVQPRARVRQPEWERCARGERDCRGEWDHWVHLPKARRSISVGEVALASRAGLCGEITLAGRETGETSRKDRLAPWPIFHSSYEENYVFTFLPLGGFYSFTPSIFTLLPLMVCV
ncbi:hypothetical protein KSP40_PGU014467 [Platanthera guangdongensis]|uniref:Uncharacterized protein n=1 Tax=Platanthera guangdongensis TaxID=2320717 RepID=A0ABR2LSQ7_9ASPA